MLWDMPGVTTKAKHYFHEHCLGAFDALLIVSSDRLMATDIKLARKAIEYGVPVFFIRNKADTVSRARSVWRAHCQADVFEAGIGVQAAEDEGRRFTITRRKVGTGSGTVDGRGMMC